MREYCIATTSSEDMKDFTKILRNKFKSGRYFKRHQALGYLPVQSLHEGDSIEESSSSIVHTLRESYSHAPSSNTTPVHTLSHPQRAASPGALTQRDLQFFMDNRLVYSNRNPSMNIDPIYQKAKGEGIYAHYDLPSSASSSRYGSAASNRVMSQSQTQTSQGKTIQTSIEHHLPTGGLSGPSGMASSSGPSPLMTQRTLSENASPVDGLYQSNDELHKRLRKYANRLAEVELNKSNSNRSDLIRGSSGRSMKLDSLNFMPNMAHRQSSLDLDDKNTIDKTLVQSPTELLGKVAFDERNEMEIIIQRLQDENK